ncbi:hypothetical protein GCM10010191_34820 [Actinomadura vinacea]|uniref:DUF5753 domain-containing protein n=1 Tax=Actinomadura vinacea TaxID=115336 RepID=A0ABN3J476_9ACTN
MIVPADRRRLAAALISDLEILRSSAGQPSFVTIERESEKHAAARAVLSGVKITRLPVSTVHDLLRHDRTPPLRPDLVESLWAVLHHIAAEKGRTPRPPSLNALDELRNRLEAINLPERVRVASPTGPAESAGIAMLDDPFGGAPPGRDEDADRRWLLDAAAATRATAWWHSGSHLVPEWLGDHLTLEHRAGEVRTYAPHAIPALLQTEGYAWSAIRRDRPKADPAELHGLVHLRMRRQEPLWRRDALRVWAVIDESVLRDESRGHTTMRAQLDHLVKVSGMQHITVQVMPSHAHGHDSTGGPVSLLRFPERGFPDVAFIEQHDYGLCPPKSTDVSHYHQVLVRLAIEALRPKESAEFLRAIRSAWSQ